MRQRCLNPANKNYADYGGRGITLCERWLVFDNFLADMGEQPDGLWLERKNNARGYSKANCTWATPTQQAANKRVRKDALFYKGRRVKEWASIWGTSYHTAKARIYAARRTNG